MMFLHRFSAASSVDKGECMGGSTLSLLHDRTFNYTGDSQAQELCLYLTKAASVPYFEILEKWIYRGIIKDPYRHVCFLFKLMLSGHTHNPLCVCVCVF